MTTDPALIVFDIDGTLLRTDRVTVPAVRETFAAFGLPEPEGSLICDTFGKAVEGYEAWLASLCPPGLAAEVVAATNARELECIGPAGLYPGAREALDTLHAQGHRLAIASNGYDGYVDRFADVHELRSLFALICARGTRFSGKHAMAEHIASRFPERPLIVVGDRRDDIESAHAQGGFAIGAAYGFGDDDELQDADLRIDHAAHIPSAVDQLLLGGVGSA